MRHIRYFYTLLLTQQKQKPKQGLHKGIKPSKILQLERHVKEIIFRRLCKELFIPEFLQQFKCVARQFYPSCGSAVCACTWLRMCRDNVT